MRSQHQCLVMAPYVPGKAPVVASDDEECFSMVLDVSIPSLLTASHLSTLEKRDNVIAQFGPMPVLGLIQQLEMNIRTALRSMPLYRSGDEAKAAGVVASGSGGGE